MTQERDLAVLLTHLAHGLDRSAALLVEATELHRQLSDLHAELAGATVELVNILKLPADVSAPVETIARKPSHLTS
jgi:hypothetical protein